MCENINLRQRPFNHIPASRVKPGPSPDAEAAGRHGTRARGANGLSPTEIRLAQLRGRAARLLEALAEAQVVCPCRRAAPTRCGATGRRERYLHPDRRERRDGSGPLSGAAPIGDRSGHCWTHTCCMKQTTHHTGYLKSHTSSNQSTCKNKTDTAILSF